MQNNEVLNTPLEKASFTVVDVETTGLSANRNRIIEIGMVRIENLKIKKRFHSLINPQTIIPPFITSLTGISNEDVEDAPTFNEISESISEFIDNSVLTAHNFTFDWSFLNTEFIISGKEFYNEHSCCTLKLSRKFDD